MYDKTNISGVLGIVEPVKISKSGAFLHEVNPSPEAYWQAVSIAAMEQVVQMHGRDSVPAAVAKRAAELADAMEAERKSRFGGGR